MTRESNFEYVKGTDIEECYENLKKAEFVYQSFPDATIMCLRSIAETVLIKVRNEFYKSTDNSGTYYGIMGELITVSEVKFSKVYREFNIIRLNGNYVLHPEAVIEEETKRTPTELLEIMHNILIWYLQDIKNKSSIDSSKIKFINPNNFNNEKKELTEVKKKISEKNKKIFELKLKIKHLKDSEKDKADQLFKLNKEIDNINVERLELKEKDELLEKKIKEHDKEIENIKKKYKIELQEKIEKFKKEHRESEKASNETELVAVKNEILIKNNEITELKSKIDDFKEESKDKLELQKEIEKIKAEKEKLESMDSILTKGIKEYDIELKRIKEQHQRDLDDKINELKSKEDTYLKEKEELNNIRQEIHSKENEINELRAKVDELRQQSKEINLLKISIDDLQSEKGYLENRDRILTNTILEKDKELENIKEAYKANAEKIEILRKERNESNASLKNKEEKLIKVEKENFELKRQLKEIEETAKIEAIKRDEELKRKEKELHEGIEKLRQAYKNSFELTREYQDVLEKSEYSYDKEQERLLNIQKTDVKEKLVEEDKSFHNNLNEYSEGVRETNERIRTFKKVLKEKSIKEGKHVAFYRGFLGLEGEQLRILYTMLTKTNISSILISKSKELLSQSNEDKFMEFIHKKARELNHLSDEEVRLKIYYRLIKLTDIEYKNIYERRSFVETLDEIVNAGYSILEGKKDFKGGGSKLEAIGTYYLEKVLEDFKNKYDSGDIKVQQELIDNIYNNFQRLSEKAKKEIYDELHLKSTSESTVKAAIRSAPFVFLSTTITVGGFSAFSAVSSIIFGISHLLGTTFSYGVYTGASSLLSFFSGPFMIILFIVNGGVLFTQHKKQQLELVPLFIMQTIITNVAIEKTKINFDNYDTMIELWKREKGNFDKITLQKRLQENILNNYTKERDEFAAKSEQVSKAINTLWEEHAKYNHKFKDIVLSSDKKVYLNSYGEYSSTINKLEMVQKEIDETKNKVGTLKSIFSLDMWKGQSSKLVNEMNMINMEKLLVEEAKQSQYFKEESALFSELQQKIDVLNEIQNKTKEKIKDKNNLISVLKNKVNLLENDLVKINSEYPDINNAEFMAIG